MEKQTNNYFVVTTTDLICNLRAIFFPVFLALNPAFRHHSLRQKWPAVTKQNSHITQLGAW
jgi:hypothetical protein